MAEFLTIPEVNFEVHRKGGFSEEIGRYDENGVQADLAARVYKLQTSTGLDLTLAAHPDNALSKLMVLSEAQVASFGPAGTEVKYAVVDTSSTPDEILLFGRFVVQGW